MKTSLETLEKAQGQPLVWKHKGAFSRDYGLFKGDTQIASLRLTKAGGSLAEGTMEEQTWTFKRVGFWKPYVSIRNPESGETEIARFPIDRHGTLTLQDGTAYIWRQVSFWKSEWAFFDVVTNQMLLHFVPKNFLSKNEVQIDITPEISKRSDLPLLILFGWYLLVMAMMEESVVVTTVCSSVAVC